jgi:hypothetical protein
VDAATERAQQLSSQQEASSSRAGDGVIKREIIWFHHIKNPYKRKVVVAWAQELGLGGASKPGYPGLCVHCLLRLSFSSVWIV